MRKFILLGFMLILGMILAACSSSSIIGHEWGSTIDSVVKKEEKKGNYLTKTSSSGEVNLLEYDDIDLDIYGQVVDFMEYGFKENFNGKEYEEPVLFEVHYFLNDDSLEEDDLFKKLEKRYGEGEYWEGSITGMSLWTWEDKETTIEYSEAGIIQIRHTSEPY